MVLLILGADSSKEMENLARQLSDKKFKVIEQDKEFILMKKRAKTTFVIVAK